MYSFLIFFFKQYNNFCLSLQNDASINCKNSYQQSPLAVAAAYNHVAIIEFLLKVIYQGVFPTHTVILPDWTLKKWGHSNFAFQHC